MLGYVILGLLRNGQTSHGYQLSSAYHERSGRHVSTASFYRDLARLRLQGEVEVADNPPEADHRRIPYRITAAGRLAFDDWLTSTRRVDDDLETRLLFLDFLPGAHRAHLIALWSDALRRQRDRVAQSHLRAASRGRLRGAPGGFDPLPAILRRELLRLDAELRFLQEFHDEAMGAVGRAAEAQGRGTHPVLPEASDDAIFSVPPSLADSR